MKRAGLLNTVALLVILGAFLLGLWLAEPPEEMVPKNPAANNGTAAAANTTTVHIDGFAYYPPVLTVPRGTTVTWVNKYPVAHRVNSDGASPNFTSPNLPTGGWFTWTFTDSGNFTYFCQNHPNMKGMIVVK